MERKDNYLRLRAYYCPTMARSQSGYYMCGLHHDSVYTLSKTLRSLGTVNTTNP